MRAKHTLLLAVLLALTGCAGSSGLSRGVRSTTGPGAGKYTYSNRSSVSFTGMEALGSDTTAPTRKIQVITFNAP